MVPLLVAADRLTPNPENPHDGDSDAVLDSLMVNGCYRPVYARKDGTILAGHTLYAALLEAGATEVPVLWVDADDEATSRRIMLGDNQVARLGQDDPAQVVTLLRALDSEDSLVGTGYTAADLAALEAMLARLGDTPLEPETGTVRVLLEFTPVQHRLWAPLEERVRARGVGLEAGLLAALTEHAG
jgi:ParB-like chromosome segregation protein Spo0J